jgi:hypothetical protein
MMSTAPHRCHCVSADRDGKLVYNRWKIAGRYLATWFVIDVAVSMPWDNIFSGTDYTVIKALRVCAL